jgi:hypothetical protein
MNDEQRWMAAFWAQRCGTGHFCPPLRYFSLMCIKHTALEMPCTDTKMATPLWP